MWLKLYHNISFFEGLLYTNCQITLCSSHFSQHLYQSIFSWEVRNNYDILNLAGDRLNFSFFFLRIYEKFSASGVVHHNPGEIIEWWAIQLCYSWWHQLGFISYPQTGHVGLEFLNVRMFLIKEIFSVRGLWQKSSRINCLFLNVKWVSKWVFLFLKYSAEDMICKAFNKWKNL